jgi:hypothetical protein
MERSHDVVNAYVRSRVGAIMLVKRSGMPGIERVNVRNVNLKINLMCETYFVW